MSLNALQLQSIGNEEAGNAFAIYEMGRTKGAGLKFLTNLVAALPEFPVGGVSTENIGIMIGELKASQASISDTSSTLYSQVGSFLALISQSQATAGGPETIDQGILVQVGNNLALGIKNALAELKGEAEGEAGA